MVSMSERAALLDRFAAGTRWTGAARQPLAGDASSRRYERWVLPETSETCILMDAPPGPGMSVDPFVHIARHLTATGFSAPDILAKDAMNGFLLIEDFGDAVFARLIDDDPECEARLYEAAVDVLIDLHSARLPDRLIDFTPALMAKQAGLVLKAYGPRPEMIGPFCAALETILITNASLPRVLILRDYHAENLIWLPERSGVKRVGLLDFQDAMIGPVGYDLVSLIHDARRDVSREMADRLVARFVAALDLDPVEFEATRAILCAQRNLRILGIFAKLAQVQGKDGYVDLIPRVWTHLMNAMTHPALEALRPFVADLPSPTPGHLENLRSQCTQTCP